MVGAFDEHKVAQYLSYQVSTLRNWRSQGRGPAYIKIDGWTVRYLKEDLDDWLKSQVRVRREFRVSGTGEQILSSTSGSPPSLPVASLPPDSLGGSNMIDSFQDRQRLATAVDKAGSSFHPPSWDFSTMDIAGDGGMRLRKRRRTKPDEDESREVWELINAMLFDHNLGLDPFDPEKVKTLLQEVTGKNLSGKVGDKHVQYFEILLANLIHQIPPRKNRKIRVPKTKAIWNKMEQRIIPYQFMFDTISQLEEKKYIGLKGGYRVRSNSKTTRIWATPKLFKRFDGVSTRIRIFPPLIVFKDSVGDTSHLLRGAKFKAIETLLRDANEVNREAGVRDKRGTPV